MSERLFNSFIHPKNFYTPQNKFLATPLYTTLRSLNSKYSMLKIYIFSAVVQYKSGAKSIINSKYLREMVCFHSYV